MSGPLAAHGVSAPLASRLGGSKSGVGGLLDASPSVKVGRTIFFNGKTRFLMGKHIENHYFSWGKHTNCEWPFFVGM